MWRGVSSIITLYVTCGTDDPRIDWLRSADVLEHRFASPIVRISTGLTFRYSRAFTGHILGGRRLFFKACEQVRYRRTRIMQSQSGSHGSGLNAPRSATTIFDYLQ